MQSFLQEKRGTEPKSHPVFRRPSQRETLDSKDEEKAFRYIFKQSDYRHRIYEDKCRARKNPKILRHYKRISVHLLQDIKKTDCRRFALNKRRIISILI